MKTTINTKQFRGCENGYKIAVKSLGHESQLRGKRRLHKTTQINETCSYEFLFLKKLNENEHVERNNINKSDYSKTCKQMHEKETTTKHKIHIKRQ